MEFRFAPEAAAGEHHILLRIDVPGSEDAEEPDDHELGMIRTDPGHAFRVFVHPDGATEAIGWHPESSFEGARDVRSGVAGETHDEATHPYEYEADFEVSEEGFQAALRYARGQEARNWGQDYGCADFAGAALREAGVESLPNGVSNEVIPYSLPTERLEMNYPGTLAHRLYDANIGRYVDQDNPSGATEPPKWGGLFGSFD